MVFGSHHTLDPARPQSGHIRGGGRKRKGEGEKRKNTTARNRSTDHQKNGRNSTVTVTPWRRWKEPLLVVPRSPGPPAFGGWGSRWPVAMGEALEFFYALNVSILGLLQTITMLWHYRKAYTPRNPKLKGQLRSRVLTAARTPPQSPWASAYARVFGGRSRGRDAEFVSPLLSTAVSSVRAFPRTARYRPRRASPHLHRPHKAARMMPGLREAEATLPPNHTPPAATCAPWQYLRVRRSPSLSSDPAPTRLTCTLPVAPTLRAAVLVLFWADASSWSYSVPSPPMPYLPLPVLVYPVVQARVRHCTLPAARLARFIRTETYASRNVGARGEGQQRL
ncbi:hypothetical protein DFH06DRAFT_1138629 [Mycena polygramma]|nr:hypothetical protein DFH06DRAFT_1138629 [Mycena polygramma]